MMCPVVIGPESAAAALYVECVVEAAPAGAIPSVPATELTTSAAMTPVRAVNVLVRVLTEFPPQLYGVLTVSSENTSRGSSNPLRSRFPAGWKANDPPADATVSASTRTSPGMARSARRAARFTTLP